MIAVGVTRLDLRRPLDVASDRTSKLCRDAPRKRFRRALVLGVAVREYSTCVLA